MSLRKLHASGFTLLELMVSMVIGSIILLVAATVLGSSGDGYQRVGGGVAAEREGRAVINRLASDLSTAIHHKDGVFEPSSSAWPAERIGFLSLQSPEAQTADGRIGDLCAVSYYIKDLVIGGKTVRCLMRGFRESEETFNALDDDQIASLFAGRDNIDEPVAFGVVSFEARPKSLDNSGSWVDWSQGASDGPEALDVRIIIARPSLVAKLRTPANWDGSSLLGKPAEPGLNKDLEIFSSVIRFGSHDEP